MESEKSVGRKRRPRTKRENESVREETVEIEWGRDKLAIRRHIRLGEQRNHDVSFVSEMLFPETRRSQGVRRKSPR